MLTFTNLTIDDIEFWEGNELSEGGIEIYWSTDDIGFGSIQIFKDKKSNFKIHSERMSQGFVEKVVETLVRQAEIID